jgi:hypothetical protein
MREAAPVALAEAFLGPGRIWRPVREQDEECRWFEILRPEVAASAT